MSSLNIESPLKQNRQFKMKQGQDFKIVKNNHDSNETRGESDGEGSEISKNNFNETNNTKASVFQNTPKSSFKNTKQQLRSSFHQPPQNYQEDSFSNIITKRNQETSSNHNDSLQHSPQAVSFLGDSDFRKSKYNPKEERKVSRSLYSEANGGASNQLQHLGIDEQKLFVQALSNKRQGSESNLSPQPQSKKLADMRKSSSHKKLLPPIKQQNLLNPLEIAQSSMAGVTPKESLQIRSQQRNFSSTAKLQTNTPKSNTLNVPTNLTTKNSSILNLAGSHILTPTSNSNSNRDTLNLAQSALFSAQKKKNPLINKPMTLINNTLGQPSSISKLKMQFYQQLGGGTAQSNHATSKSGGYLSDMRNNLKVQIPTALREMVDEKNLFHSLIQPESPEHTTSNSRAVNNTNSNNNQNGGGFTYNSPLSKQNCNFAIGNSALVLLNNASQANLSFSQALQSRIGDMNYLDESKEQSQNFHSTYKNISKMQQQSDHFNSDTELSQAILYKAYQQNVLPRKLGLVKTSENDTIKNQTIKDGKKYLNLAHLNIGNTYHTVIASALTHIDFANLYSVNLSHNNLTSISIEVLLQNLPENISRIDISNNNIGVSGAAAINHAFNSKKYMYLRYLNLSKNQLGDNGLKAMSDAIQHNTSLYALDLSYNKLGDQACVYLQQILTNNSYLQEIYLQWNKFSSRGGLCIATGLSLNCNMKVLDLSHNGIGALSSLQTGLKILQSCTMVESSMRHLDLSYNQYVKAEAVAISEILALNTKLFGFHFQGNQSNAIIDPKGFMYFQTDNDILKRNILDCHMNQRNIDNINCTGQNRAQSFDCKTVDNCWLCDGWQEVKFEIKQHCSESFSGEPAFLHLDFEDYQPMYMDKDQDDPEKFVLHRMCPPGRQISFFFTDPCKNIVYTSKDYDKVDFFIPEGLNPSFYRDDDELISDGSLQKKFTVKYLDGSILSYSTPPMINVITTKSESSQILSVSDYEPNVKCTPREKEIFYKINFSDQWHRGISLFRNYTEDTEELEDKCFEEDWNNSKIPYIVATVRGSNVEECKKLIRLVYPQLRMTYKTLSVNGMSGDIFCISQNPFSVFVQATEIFDNNLIKIRDVDLNFTTSSSKALKTKSYRAPDKTLIRYEFIEVIIRLAIDKYNKTKIYPTAQQAIEGIFTSNSFLDYIMQYEKSQLWRDERFWNQQCDQVLKNNLEFIKMLWNQYADSRRGEKRYYSSVKTMSIYEFRDFVLQFELIDELYPEKEIPFTFNLSMMTQVDELNNDRYFQMNFEEFLESLGRIAEKKSLTPVGEIESQYSDLERKQLQLRYKLESFFLMLNQKYDKVFSKEKKKLTQSNTIIQQEIKGNSNTNGYYCWTNVISERKEQLKKQLKGIIKADQIQNVGSNYDFKDNIDSDFKQEGNDSNLNVDPSSLSIQGPSLRGSQNTLNISSSNFNPSANKK